ncbi:MAG: hypothetical protein IKU16_09480 [Muribaculaceae bacterium]|nr:hypothetical protein [Muribaculaceae bacterium]MBR4887482.1 hypothetical protein [Muribaculaceae bacterium]
MIKVIYNLRFWCNVEKTQCNDFPQVMICDKVLIEGNLAYLYRGGYCQQCIAKSDIIKIE